MSSIGVEIDFEALLREDEERLTAEMNAEKTFIDRITIDERKSIPVKRLTSERVAHFGIDGAGDCDRSAAAPALALPERRKQLDIDLEAGFHEAFNSGKLIAKYDEYWEKKWCYFLDCLLREEMIGSERPDFVSFCGPIADMMVTIADTRRDWKLNAILLKGVIYLRKVRRPSRFESEFGEVSKASFGVLKFLRLMTGRPNACDDLNEFEKFFAVTRVGLEEHKMLSLAEMDAVDADGSLVEVKAKQIITGSRSHENFYRRHLLRAWAQSLVAGVRTIVFGNRDANSRLRDIEVWDMDGVADECVAYWNDKKCVHFLDRLLALIKESVTDELAVYEVSFNRGQDFIAVHRLNKLNGENYFPKWFIDGETEELKCMSEK